MKSLARKESVNLDPLLVRLVGDVPGRAVFGGQDPKRCRVCPERGGPFFSGEGEALKTKEAATAPTLFAG